MPAYFNIPLGYYVTAVTIFIVFTVATRKIELGTLLTYLYLVIVATILTRNPSENARVVLTPFWSYREAMISDFTWFQVRANILMFVPVGFLLPLVIKKRALLYGVCFSAFIEILQYITHRGTCEIDDVISNTIGLIIGYMVIKLIQLLVKASTALWKKMKPGNDKKG